MAEPNASSRLANSVALTLISRFAMIAASVALPVAGWMVQRGIDSVQKVSDKIDTVRDQTFETNGAIRLIQQSQTSQSQLLADHEMRVRALENINRSHAQ